MAHSLEWNGRGLFRAYSGSVSGAEIIAVNELTFSDPRFDELRYLISDYSAVEENNVSMEDVVRIASLNFAASKSNSQIRIAIVATDENVTALAALFNFESEELKNPWKTAIFATAEEALAWATTTS